MGPAAVIWLFLTDQLEISLMHKRRRLKCMHGALARQVTVHQLFQLRIDQRHNLIKRPLSPAANSWSIKVIGRVSMQFRSLPLIDSLRQHAFPLNPSPRGRRSRSFGSLDRTYAVRTYRRHVHFLALTSFNAATTGRVEPATA